MATILELFSQPEVLNYLGNRQYPPMLGESLFPEIKRQSLEFTQIKGAGKLPVIASIHSFDTEAEIGSREATKQALKLALIKRKLQMFEEDIIALESPRNASEQEYLMKEVFNDIDTLVQGVKARVEAMRMEVLANGTLTVKENNLDTVIDYGVPTDHKEVLAGTNVWSDPNSDPLADMMRWSQAMDVVPTRALTSKDVLSALLRHPKMIAATTLANVNIITREGLNTTLASHGLPIIATYDAVYREQKADGTYVKKRYFPKNKFVMFGDEILGETIYGPTAEEVRLMRNPCFETSMVGNILAMIHEESGDPVSTWTKAVATALPSFPAADEVFQATVIA